MPSYPHIDKSKQKAILNGQIEVTPCPYTTLRSPRSPRPVYNGLVSMFHPAVEGQLIDSRQQPLHNGHGNGHSPQKPRQRSPSPTALNHVNHFHADFNPIPSSAYTPFQDRKESQKTKNKRPTFKVAVTKGHPAKSPYPHMHTPFGIEKEFFKAEKHNKDAKILYGPFVPSGPVENSKHIWNSKMVSEVLDAIDAVLSSDWKIFSPTVTLQDDGGICVGFSHEMLSQPTVYGRLRAYMNLLLRVDSKLNQFQLVKNADQWGVFPADQSVIFVFKTPWQIVAEKREQTMRTNSAMSGSFRGVSPPGILPGSPPRLNLSTLNQLNVNQDMNQFDREPFRLGKENYLISNKDTSKLGFGAPPTDELATAGNIQKIYTPRPPKAERFQGGGRPSSAAAVFHRPGKGRKPKHNHEPIQPDPTHLDPIVNFLRFQAIPQFDRFDRSGRPKSAFTLSSSRPRSSLSYIGANRLSGSIRPNSSTGFYVPENPHDPRPSHTVQCDSAKQVSMSQLVEEVNQWQKQQNVNLQRQACRPVTANGHNGSNGNNGSRRTLISMTRQQNEEDIQRTPRVLTKMDIIQHLNQFDSLQKASDASLLDSTVTGPETDNLYDLDD
eukprot:GILJ01006803.1.p1 GENE.GILJ01006803.1~~GILJ01006803.1.p1  ORF type:complete len:644 (+),score=87.97 GILJ01006803.1:113-1933(+)